MSTTEYEFEDALSDAKDQARKDLVNALDTATERLRESISLRSTIGIREASEALVAVDNALRRFGS